MDVPSKIALRGDKLGPTVSGVWHEGPAHEPLEPELRQGSSNSLVGNEKPATEEAVTEACHSIELRRESLG